MFYEQQFCRICGNRDLRMVLDLGTQHLGGVFPRSLNQTITKGPLQLVKCLGAPSDCCGLLQLRHSYDASEMYGHNYGYRSSLNSSMVDHLRSKSIELSTRARLQGGDLVLDIGSNDGTLLSCYSTDGLTLVGIDPSAVKFRQSYPSHIQVIEDLFTAQRFTSTFGTRKAKLVTSVAMFYDLDRPIEFARQVCDVLADDGLWHLEQSYLPLMLQQTSYDTICHEHIEYYAMRQIKWIMDACGLKIVDVSFNDVNGGSFAVTVAKQESSYPAAVEIVDRMLTEERAAELDVLGTYVDFMERVYRHRVEQRALLNRLRDENRQILGYGASTKGNVILQFCNLTPAEIPFIAEVNQDKFGCFTPGTNIPIISEEQARDMRPDYLLVFPWHFRNNLVRREAAFLRGGGKMIFPLPSIKVVGA